MTSRVYVHEDVFLNPGRADEYLPNQGSTWPFDPRYRNDLVGIFEQLRPFGHWPRAVNLWESDWDRMARYLTEQFGAEPPPVDDEPRDFEQWWRSSSGHRWGGWDRFMRPGPGSPGLFELAGPPRPCVVQQTLRLRHGVLDDYLAWFGSTVPAALDGAAWQPLMWLGALHDARVIVYFASTSWRGLGELGTRLPVPDPTWGTVAHTAALRPWAQSQYLHGGTRPGV